MEEENRKGIFIKKRLLPKGGKMRKDQFVICILAGILLMIVAMPETKKEEGKTSEYRLSDNASGIIKDNSDGEEGIFYDLMHTDEKGSQKMAQKIFDVIKKHI